MPFHGVLPVQILAAAEPRNSMWTQRYRHCGSVVQTFAHVVGMAIKPTLRLFRLIRVSLRRSSRFRSGCPMLMTARDFSRNVRCDSGFESLRPNCIRVCGVSLNNAQRSRKKIETFKASLSIKLFTPNKENLKRVRNRLPKRILCWGLSRWS